jgi:hypothetical protein
MELTPPLQSGEFAVATKCTVESDDALPAFVTVAVAGEDTKTPANDGNETDRNRQRTA